MMMLMMMLMMLLPLTAPSRAQECDLVQQVRSAPLRDVILPCHGRPPAAPALLGPALGPALLGPCSVASVAWYRLTPPAGRILVLHRAGPSPPLNASGAAVPAREPPAALAADGASLLLSAAAAADGGRYRCARRLRCASRAVFRCDEVSLVVTERVDGYGLRESTTSTTSTTAAASTTGKSAAASVVVVVAVVVTVVVVVVVSVVVGIVLAVKRCKRNRRASNQDASLQENDYATLGPRESGYDNIEPQSLHSSPFVHHLHHHQQLHQQLHRLPGNPGPPSLRAHGATGVQPPARNYENLRAA
ncbi:uncharacterized protein LOC116958179 isoform X2 [Petromyzon marinus]|uniref:uncharacterized protein LOC116958179 isoform X2 n=1 Tax=Petromyzon marinus TaxID=7757 RepID=UPI003F70CE20